MKRASALPTKETDTHRKKAAPPRLTEGCHENPSDALTTRYYLGVAFAEDAIPH
jgi:hypothetical protein